jgi:hypothetical protein
MAMNDTTPEVHHERRGREARRSARATRGGAAGGSKKTKWVAYNPPSDEYSDYFIHTGDGGENPKNKSRGRASRAPTRSSASTSR